MDLKVGANVLLENMEDIKLHCQIPQYKDGCSADVYDLYCAELFAEGMCLLAVSSVDNRRKVV